MLVPGRQATWQESFLNLSHIQHGYAFRAFFNTLNASQKRPEMLQKLQCWQQWRRNIIFCFLMFFLFASKPSMGCSTKYYVCIILSQTN